MSQTCAVGVSMEFGRTSRRTRAWNSTCISRASARFDMVTVCLSGRKSETNGVAGSLTRGYLESADGRKRTTSSISMVSGGSLFGCVCLKVRSEV